MLSQLSVYKLFKNLVICPGEDILNKELSYSIRLDKNIDPEPSTSIFLN